MQSLHVEGKNGQARQMGWPEEPDAGMAREAFHGLSRKPHFVLQDFVWPDHFLHEKGNARPNISEDRRSSSLLALFQPPYVVHGESLEHGHIVDSPSARAFWDLRSK